MPPKTWISFSFVPRVQIKNIIQTGKIWDHASRFRPESGENQGIAVREASLLQRGKKARIGLWSLRTKKTCIEKWISNRARCTVSRNRLQSTTQIRNSRSLESCQKGNKCGQLQVAELQRDNESNRRRGRSALPSLLVLAGRMWSSLEGHSPVKED